MISVTVFGANGRMGRAVVESLLAEKDIAIAHAVDLPRLAGKWVEDVKLKGDDENVDFSADVWVDVSLGGAAYIHALQAETHGIPILIGATGFSPDQLERLNNLKNAHIIAPNLSVGVNLLFNLAPKVREVLGGAYDVGIYETHHKHKIDAPSGTAKKLMDLLQEVGGPVQCVSLRMGEVVGEHRIRFASEGEELELVHTARSRKAFAQGVAPAVRFLCGKTDGAYTMADVLGLT